MNRSRSDSDRLVQMHRWARLCLMWWRLLEPLPLLLLAMSPIFLFLDVDFDVACSFAFALAISHTSLPGCLTETG